MLDPLNTPRASPSPPRNGNFHEISQGVSHWAVADDWSLLFDPTDSELELLDVTNGPLMKEIYRDNGSGWIKLAVVRDPVTRLVSAYVDIVRTWRAGLKRQEEVRACMVVSDWLCVCCNRAASFLSAVCACAGVGEVNLDGAGVVPNE